MRTMTETMDTAGPPVAVVRGERPLPAPSRVPDEAALVREAQQAIGTLATVRPRGRVIEVARPSEAA